MSWLFRPEKVEIETPAGRPLLAVRGGATFLPPDSPAIETLREHYRLPNPEFKIAMGLHKKGKYVALPHKWIEACREIPYDHAWGGGLAVPRCANVGNVHRVMKTTCPIAEPVQLVPEIKLRNYQEVAVRSLLSRTEGLVIAPCGSGKTTIGLGAIAAIPTKALVLVHTSDLAEQWITRCKQQLDVEATLVGAGNFDDSGRVVVALFQTLTNMRWSERYFWAKQFGLVIVDEAHHTPAETFSDVMMTMPAKHRLGLTATPERADKLTDILYWHFGTKLHEITTKNLMDAGVVMSPNVVVLQTGWSPPRGEDWVKMVGKMVASTQRNEFIEDVAMQLLETGRQVLLLSDRVAHCEIMAERLQQRGVESQALVGRLSKKRRKELLERAGSGEIRVLTATTLADEGLDLPGLGAVIMTVPTKNMPRVQQRIGRVMRTSEGKQTPIVIDLMDNAGSMRGMARKRCKLYRDLGCQFVDMEEV